MGFEESFSTSNLEMTGDLESHSTTFKHSCNYQLLPQPTFPLFESGGEALSRFQKYGQQLQFVEASFGGW